MLETGRRRLLTRDQTRQSQKKKALRLMHEFQRQPEKLQSVGGFAVLVLRHLEAFVPTTPLTFLRSATSWRIDQGRACGHRGTARLSEGPALLMLIRSAASYGTTNESVNHAIADLEPP